MDPRLEKLAKVLIHYSLKMKRGQWLLVAGEPAAMPLIKAVCMEAIDTGGHPVVKMKIPDLEEYLLKHGDKSQLIWLPPTAMVEFKNIDAYVGIWGGENTRYLSGVNPDRQATARTATKKVMQVFYQRSAKKELRWCGTQFPTLSSAQDAGMSLTEYEDFVFGAGHLLKSDPVKHWQKVYREQQRLVRVLNRVDQIHILSNDTDLKLRVKGRKWINCAGENNFPDGEIFTGPIETSAEGKIRYTYPAVYMGQEVEDVTLEFKKGKVIKASAARNEKFLASMLEMDKGARYLGELAVGTNYDIKRFTKNTLFDEKIGGTCHLAVGNAFSETGSKNKSSLHWDMVCDLKKGGEIIADGKTIYRNGKFVI